MGGILDAIDAALAKKGLSDAAASELAVGNPSLLKNMRVGKGRFTWQSLDALAKVLDLECYFGPPRTGSLNGGANPPPGFAEPPETFRLDAAPGIWRRPARPLPDRPFVLEVPDIFREELEAAFALVDPTIPVELGALVCARDAEGRVAFGRYLGLGTRPGWIRLRLHGGAAIDERSSAATPHLDPVTWRGTTPPPDRLAMTPGQKARLLADARRHLRYVEELLEEDDR